MSNAPKFLLRGLYEITSPLKLMYNFGREKEILKKHVVCSPCIKKIYV